MIDKSHALPVTRHAELLALSRSNVYYALHLEYPFAGARMLRNMLALEGIDVGSRHVGTLMAKMGVEAIYRKRNTSKPHPEHRIYPYLLRDLVIDRPKQV